MATCVGPPATILKGSTGVFIGGLPAARLGDRTAHGGSIVFGSPNVIIGEVGTGAPGKAGFNAVISGLVVAIPADQDSSWLSQFGSGLFDSTLAPIGHIIAHPILTAEGIGHAAAHPIQTGKALGSAVANTASGVMSGDPRAIGTALGTAGMLFLPGAGEADVAEDAARISEMAETAEAGEEGAFVANKLPQGLTNEQFEKLSDDVRSGTTQYSDDAFVHGSRATGMARADSDIDIGIRVPEDKFNQVVQERFGSPNPGSAKEATMQNAIDTGKIQSGEAGLRGLRKSLEQSLGMDVDISVIKQGGPFDNGPYIPLK